MGADRGHRKKARSRSRSRSRSRKRGRRRAGSEEGAAPAARGSARGSVRDAPELRPSGLLDDPEAEAERRARRSRSRDEVQPPPGLRRGAADAANSRASAGGPAAAPGESAEPKEEPNFEPSGLLGMEDNSKNGVALKFTCPPEARTPTMKWRFYIFMKQTEAPKIVHVHRKVGYLFGRDRRVVDVPTDHLTCSTQHAVLHYRLTVNGEVKPYIMDLESTNGTFLNGTRLEPARYYEMKERDVLKFGMSTREFVLLHAGSANYMPIDPSKLRSDSE